jgi:hypothetical protein
VPTTIARLPFQFSSDIITSRSDAAPPETVATAKIDATAVEPRRASRARNRFAAFSIAASLVVAVCVGMQDLKQINHRLLIATTDGIGANARQVLAAQEKSVVRYHLADFENATVDYPDSIERLAQGKRKPPPEPRW